jgi:hypothetical protein
MSFIDFVVDLMWGASEACLARRKARKAASRGESIDTTDPDQREPLDKARADREKVERLIGNKTV